MGFLVTGSALLKCTFGAAPSALMVLPTNFVRFYGKFRLRQYIQ